MFDYHGRRALVTGAGQNVGEGIATALAAAGAEVFINDYFHERAERVASELNELGYTAHPLPFDVTDYDAAVAAISSVGALDVLVNNAGNGGAHGMAPTKFRDSTPASWRGPIDVNLYGVMNCCHAVIGDMCDRGYGRIVTIASGAGLVGLSIGVSPYAAGKGGAISFMRHLAVESARSGVTANTLAIGLMTMEDHTVTEALARQIPTGRTGLPTDIASAVVWIASEESNWVTGQTISINGGSTTS